MASSTSRTMAVIAPLLDLAFASGADAIEDIAPWALDLVQCHGDSIVTAGRRIPPGGVAPRSNTAWMRTQHCLRPFSVRRWTLTTGCWVASATHPILSLGLVVRCYCGHSSAQATRPVYLRSSSAPLVTCERNGSHAANGPLVSVVKEVCT